MNQESQRHSHFSHLAEFMGTPEACHTSNWSFAEFAQVLTSVTRRPRQQLLGDLGLGLARRFDGQNAHISSIPVIASCGTQTLLLPSSSW